MRRAKRYEYTDILGWSATRYGTFSMCRRMYFYTYYSKYDREIPQRVIDGYKKLVSVPLEIGSVVHKVIQILLNRLQKSNEEIDRDRFYDFAKRELKRGLSSKQFEEVVYGNSDAIEASLFQDKVIDCLENLLASERYQWLSNEAWQAKDEWIIEPPGYGETRLDDLKVYCKVDYLFPVDNCYQIIDWKTGKPDPDKHRKQLMGYSAWATHNFEVSTDQVKPVIAYLQPEYTEVEETFNEFDLENLSIDVQAETNAMYEYCRDVKQNIPLGKQEFEMVTNEKICSFCKFRGICYPDRHPCSLNQVD